MHDVARPGTTEVECEGDGHEPRPRCSAHPVQVLLVFGVRDAETDGMLRGIAQYLQTRGDWNVRLEARERSGAEWRRLLAQGWRGVIGRKPSAALAEACAEFRLPLVALAETPDGPSVSKVSNDEQAIGVMGAEFLLERGFRTLGFFGDGARPALLERERGFVDAARCAGREVEVLRSEVGPGGEGPEEAALASWLCRLPKPVAVMACDDRRAMRLAEAARRAGLQIPEELALLGAGNDEVLCGLTTPTLSSVAPASVLVGFRAAEHLAQLLETKAPRGCDLRIEPVETVGRRSTDAMAIPDRAVAAAVRYIAEHACRGVTVSEVLPCARVSRAQLEKKFRRYLGRSPQAEIRRVQVARIRRYLIESDLPLKQIAELTGFAYMEYMCVVFRRLTGETPGAYRRRRRPVAGGATG